MLFSGFTFNHYIINVYFHCAANQGFEDLCHQSLIGGTGIFESEWHDFITIKPMWSYKDCLFFVGKGHGDLVVSGEGI